MRMSSTTLNFLPVQSITPKFILGYFKRCHLALLTLAIIMVFGVKDGLGQTAPTFIVISPPTVTTLQVGNRGITFTSAFIPTVLGVSAIGMEGLESLTYSPGPDTIDPVITCPPDPPDSPNSFGDCSAFVAIDSAIATDDCPGVVITNDFNANGAVASDTFPVGTTIVTYTATDTAGNFSTCFISVIVIDLESPSIGCPLPTSAGTDPGQCYNSTLDIGMPSFVFDNCGVDTVYNNAPDTFLMGPTTVTWTIVDNVGNMATCPQMITI